MNLFWKIYFWIMLISTFRNLLLLLNYSDKINWSGYWLSFTNYYLPLSVVGLIGLFGYSYSKQILNKKLWKSLFLFLLLLFLYSRIQFFLTIPGNMVFHYINFFYLILPLPMLIALYRYAEIKPIKIKQQKKKSIVFK